MGCFAASFGAAQEENLKIKINSSSALDGFAFRSVERLASISST